MNTILKFLSRVLGMSEKTPYQEMRENKRKAISEQAAAAEKRANDYRAKQDSNALEKNKVKINEQITSEIKKNDERKQAYLKRKKEKHSSTSILNTNVAIASSTYTSGSSCSISDSSSDSSTNSSSNCD